MRRIRARYPEATQTVEFLPKIWQKNRVLAEQSEHSLEAAPIACQFFEAVFGDGMANSNALGGVIRVTALSAEAASCNRALESGRFLRRIYSDHSGNFPLRGFSSPLGFDSRLITTGLFLRTGLTVAPLAAGHPIV